MPRSKIIGSQPNLGRRNLIVNGGFEIDQRNSLTTPVTSASTLYPKSVDGNWFGVEQTGGQISTGKVADAPVGTGLKSSYKITVTSADTSLGATERMCPTQGIEASTWQHLEWHTANAKPITVQFWVKCSVTGTFGFSFRTAGAGMSYTHPYTINSANTWEKKIFTILGPTSLLGGSVGSGNAIYYYIIFGLGLGTNYDTGADNTWTAVGNGQGRSAHTNLMATNGATWQMTGFQIEEGTNHSDFEHRTVAEELALCQRYFYRYEASIVEWIYCEGNAAAHKFWYFRLPVEMRATPSFSHNFTHSTSNGIQISSIALQGQSNNRILVRVYYSQANGSNNTMHHTDGWNDSYAYASAEF